MRSQVATLKAEDDRMALEGTWFQRRSRGSNTVRFGMDLESHDAWLQERSPHER
jgi:hypothetical protein